MNIIESIINKVLAFEKEPQKVGLSQLSVKLPEKKPEVSLKSKNVKLSDLMRRAS